MKWNPRMHSIADCCLSVKAQKPTNVYLHKSSRFLEDKSSTIEKDPYLKH